MQKVFFIFVFQLVWCHDLCKYVAYGSEIFCKVAGSNLTFQRYYQVALNNEIGKGHDTDCLFTVTVTA